MSNTFRIGFLLATFLLDIGASKKYHVGPCIIVREPEPCPDPDYIQVYLFTRDNPTEGQQVKYFETTDNLTSSYFVPKNPNKIIIHGFNTDMHLDVLHDIKTEYLKHSDVNIWMVNYPKLVENAWCYLSAVNNLEHVGKCLAQFVAALRRHGSNDIHVVGFSLGAQVSNHLANSLGEKKIDRITGLDPAGPLFTLRGKKHRLDAGDAKFVDVVHTNGGIQGDLERCGHIDFFMNGGVTQPGCSKNKDFLNCNHRRAPQYFAESINSQVGFLGWKCESVIKYFEGHCKPNKEKALMGEHCPPRSSGFYVVITASDKPFALGMWTKSYFLKRLFQEELPKFLKKEDESQISVNDPIQRIFLE